MPCKVIIEPRALADIQDGIDYYEEQLEGLGERFSKTVDHSSMPYLKTRITRSGTRITALCQLENSLT